MPIISKLLIIFFSVSCANVKYVTDTNLSQYKNISKNRDYQLKLDEKIMSINQEQAKECQDLGKHFAKDNPLDVGEKWAIYYAKDKTLELEGNAIRVIKSSQVGDYGHEVYFQAYKCEKATQSDQ